MTERDDPLRLDVSPADSGVVVVNVAGELDPHTATMLEETFREVDDPTVRKVVLDLSEVTFIDSSGLRVVLSAHDTMSKRDGTLTLRSPSEAVRRLLEITDLLDRLDVE